MDKRNFLKKISLLGLTALPVVGSIEKLMGSVAHLKNDELARDEDFWDDEYSLASRVGAQGTNFLCVNYFIEQCSIFCMYFLKCILYYHCKKLENPNKQDLKKLSSPVVATWTHGYLF